MLFILKQLIFYLELKIKIYFKGYLFLITKKIKLNLFQKFNFEKKIFQKLKYIYKNIIIIIIKFYLTIYI